MEEKRFVLRIDVHETDMCRLEKPNMKDNWSVKRFYCVVILLILVCNDMAVLPLAHK